MELRVNKVCASHPQVKAVRDVDLAVRDGQVVAIVGPNGCGKSTLLRTIARLHKPDSGTVTIDAENVWSMSAKRAAHRIALLPQSPTAPEAITVADLVAHGRHPHQGLFRQWSRADAIAADTAMHDTSIVPLAGRRMETLSGGQRQRAWLAMSLAQETPIVLLDEPTSALDLGHTVEMLTLVRDIADSGRAIVMVVHDLVSAARYSDVVVAMRDGEVIASGPAASVVTSDLVRRLYDIDADVLSAPGDAAPVVVPRAQSLGRDSGADNGSPSE
ncbi:MAG TPA: ABC transporter ATP-binding protein [Candidatus Stackebrandtia faecavium]|nr:ABC transporter ATP-binding protein [Candidatus Stackebrandtia faecavium]